MGGSYPEFAPRNLPFRIVEGFRAPTGVLNPDRYDPRIGKCQAMGISDSVGSAVPTECYLMAARTASTRRVFGDGTTYMIVVLAPHRSICDWRRRPM